MSEKFKTNIEYVISVVFFAIVNVFFFYLNAPFLGLAILFLYAYFKLFISLGKDHKSKMKLLFVCSILFYPRHGREMFVLVMLLEKDLYNSKSLENDLIMIEKFRFAVSNNTKNFTKEDREHMIKLLKELDKYLELKYFFCKQRIKIIQRRKLKELLNDY